MNIRRHIWNFANKYTTPHKRTQEKARRRRQIAKGMIRVTG